MFKIGSKVEVINENNILRGSIGILLNGGLNEEGIEKVNLIFDDESIVEFNPDELKDITDSTHALALSLITTLMMNDFQDYVLSQPEQRVVDWGDQAGVNIGEGDQETCFSKLSQIADMLIEEAKEMKEGCEKGDLLEILDGVTDIRFVLEQALESLRRIDVDVDGALHAVCDNNDLKVYDDYDVAMKDMRALELKNSKEYLIDSNVFLDQEYFCIKDRNGKVTKSVNHPHVDLTPFLTSNINGEEALH
jgi:hypothetical protein